MLKIVYKKQFEDVSDSVLKEHGIINLFEFKEELYEIFIAYEKAYFNYEINKRHQAYAII